MRAIIFTLCYFKLNPAISETQDSSNFRLVNIQALIKKARWSIHDLSRMQPASEELARFNMPFELGLDIGCKQYGRSRGNKILLVMKREQYRIQRALSDLNGCDIRSHNENPNEAIECVRDWLNANNERRLNSWNIINRRYAEFETDLTEKINEEELPPVTELGINDYIVIVKEWCQKELNP